MRTSSAVQRVEKVGQLVRVVHEVAVAKDHAVDALAEDLLATVHEQGVAHVDPGVQVLGDHQAQAAVVLGDVMQQLELYLRAAAHDVGDAHEVKKLAASDSTARNFSSPKSW